VSVKRLADHNLIAYRHTYNNIYQLCNVQSTIMFYNLCIIMYII